jgi:hypothetical protein
MGNKSFVFRFADVEVREREFTLIKAGKALTVEPKAFRALLFLLHNPQRLISKEELLNSLWGDAAVTEGSLTRCIWLLRPRRAVNGTAVKAASSCGRCCRKVRNAIAMPATTMSNKTDASIQRRDQFERCTKGAPLESSGAAVSADDGLAPGSPMPWATSE